MGRPDHSTVTTSENSTMTQTDRVKDARQRLRSGTHREHVRLNQHPMLIGLTRPGYPMPRYRMLMTAYYHFYRAVEAGIEQFGDSAFEYSSRLKLPWLADDLAYLGINPFAADNLPQRPIPDMVPADIAELAGVLYTIEGSTLGAQVISRHLSSHQEIGPDRGGRFFLGYSHLTDQHWNQFEVFLNLTLVTDAMIERAVSSAQGTFLLIEALLYDFHKRVH